MEYGAWVKCYVWIEVEADSKKEAKEAAVKEASRQVSSPSYTVTYIEEL